MLRWTGLSTYQECWGTEEEEEFIQNRSEGERGPERETCAWGLELHVTFL